MDELWNKIIGYLEKKEPDVVSKNLNGPASDGDIKTLEDYLKFKLPSELVECLKIHNGQNGYKHFTLLENFALLSTFGIKSSYENDIINADDEDLENVSFEHGVKKLSRHNRWIPIARHYHSANVFFIDLDPATGGKKGQIIAYNGDNDNPEYTYSIVADDFKQWFTDIVNARINNSELKLLDKWNMASESFKQTTGFSMKNAQSINSIVTLANASELAIAVTQQIMGNEVADTLNGSPITRELIHNLAQTTFQSAIQTRVGV